MQIKYELPKLPNNIVDQYNTFMKNKKRGAKKQASQLSTICKMLKVSVGTVVLALPEGFRRVYILGGILTLIICGILQCYAWNLLILVIEDKAKIKKQELDKQKQEEQQPEIEIELSEEIDLNHEEIPEDTVVIDEQKEEHNLEEPSNLIPQTQSDNPLTSKITFSKMNMFGVIKLINPDNKAMVIFIEIITLFLFFGQAVSLIIFFNQTFTVILPQINNQEYYKVFLAFGTIALIMSFSFIKNMEKLRCLTNCGSYLVFIVMYFFSSICLYEIKEDAGRNKSINVNYGINILEIPFFFGVSLFSYDINGMLTEIREEMQAPRHFKGNLATSMIICCVIYVIFGVCGYMAYGDQTDTLITTNLDNTISSIGIGIKSAFLTIQMMYALSMLLTVMLQNVVSIRLLEDLPIECSKKSDEPKKLGLICRLLIRILYIGGCVFTATYFQNFTVVISLLGSIASVALGFVMPYYLHKKAFPRVQWYYEIVNVVVLLFGIIGGILGVTSVFVTF